MLGGTFDLHRALDDEKTGLRRLQKLFNAAAQQWPVILFNGKVPTEIEYGDLAHFTANALTAHQSVREVGLASDGVVSLCSAYKHPLILQENKGKNQNNENIMAQQNAFKITPLFIKGYL
jgi:hypothetical protein